MVNTRRGSDLCASAKSTQTSETDESEAEAVFLEFSPGPISLQGLLWYGGVCVLVYCVCSVCRVWRTPSDQITPIIVTTGPCSAKRRCFFFRTTRCLSQIFNIYSSIHASCQSTIFLLVKYV